MKSQPRPDTADAADVRMLADYAALPLGPERIAAVQAVLAAWIVDANELSRKMSAAAHQELMPVTTFAHAHGTFEEPS